MPSPGQLASARGFTLLEILIVVFLIGLTLSVVAPTAVRISNLDSAARVLAAELRYAGQRATATGEVHRLAIELDTERGQRFRIERRPRKSADDEEPQRLPGSPALLDLRPPQSEGDFEPIPTQQGEWRDLGAEDVVIASVLIGEVEYFEDVTFIGFAGQGGADPAEIRLLDEAGDFVSIRVLPFTGEVRVGEVFRGE